MATNAVQPSSLGRRHYLETNKEQLPLNYQVPQSVQNYAGTGGTISFQGHRNFIVSGSLTSALNVTLTSQDMLNLVGKNILVILDGNEAENVVFTLPSGALFISEDVAFDGLATSTNTAGDTLVRNFIFVSATQVAVQ